ncbi:MAG: bifunctional diaminohydroxyphosphoribosylaminopyrimidine deaminase/5-amino-6-(5-phosphoribosylamino)uracil reductase RibD [Myxococcota bacterium]
MTPEAAMRLALAQARASSGRTAPNPPVGAVVFRGDRVLGRGRTQPPGGPHAEIVALDRALRRHGARAVRGASLAVTLEPCCHQGRTGPCTERILADGIARVFAGHVDPHRAVAGRGVARLRRRGVRVEVGVLEAECREQHRGFVSRVRRGRPFVVLKLAATLDGRIATASGESRWITGPEARAVVHRLRARSDAVMVGAGTAAADDPALTARRGGRVVHRPVRVLVDPGLRVPPTAKLYAGSARTLVLCARSAPARRRSRLEKGGATLLPVPKRGGGLDLDRGLAALAEEGVCELLVEGGGRLAASLLRRELVDEVHWFLAPRFLGADGRPALGDLGLARLAQAPELVDVVVRRVGSDLHVRGRPAGGGRAKGRG